MLDKPFVSTGKKPVSVLSSALSVWTGLSVSGHDLPDFGEATGEGKNQLRFPRLNDEQRNVVGGGSLLRCQDRRSNRRFCRNVFERRWMASPSGRFSRQGVNRVLAKQSANLNPISRGIPRRRFLHFYTEFILLKWCPRWGSNPQDFRR